MKGGIQPAFCATCGVCGEREMVLGARTEKVAARALAADGWRASESAGLVCGGCIAVARQELAHSARPTPRVLS